MSIIRASQLSLAFGPKVLFEGASFSVGPHDRVGLVGANGTGKSSLLRILAGEQSPDSGSLTFRRGCRVGYLPQDVAALTPGELIEVVLASVPGRGEVEARLAATEAALAQAAEAEEQLELSQALADQHAELEHFEERHGRHQAERILAGLGFSTADLRRSTATLSGGWKMRAALAGLLLTDPDLLLLDEPTNHLDIPTLTWFDAFLRGSGKAFLLISHDREFLDRQIDHVLALEPEGLRAFTGNYAGYKVARAQEEERLLAQARKVESRRAELEGFIERFGAKATKARQAQSRQKMLDKLEDVQVLEHRDTLRFHFAEAPRSGREVLRLERVNKAFGARAVYRDLSASVLRGERVGVIGPNGAGKSTLLKLVAGELAADSGEVRLGHGVVPGYYAQHHFEPEERDLEARANGTARTFGALDPKQTVLEALWDLVPDKGEAYVRGVAGSFLFSGEDADKPLGVLSGGERARVALARLLLVPANLLILDEPTNHLDLDSSEALIEALKGYEGTLLFVSHNRSFLNQLATRVWEVKDGGIEDTPGNLDDWLHHQKLLAEAAALEIGGAGGAAAGGGTAAPAFRSEKERKRLEAEARNARYAREKPLRDEIARLEARIAAVEGQEREATAALADPALYADFARARPHVDAQRQAREELERLYADWEARQAELEALAPA
ncbi:ABC-F family ATP-binding cassette domain-containing protein [Anaeromyxobacter paludicola]|uniref:Glycosyl transferase family 1 n=1 Tax=Anaeromyxobacter paludicola TaxID=2918171 RepID=A0ABN6NBE1_9BACT|nr:ABC-F family ATP-binding cassette domain-containing protein [Anaeromyxobacter paludicola]BDG10547.1 glycosyl transferase family 1 [Anaeromyxobacter paludicola]